MIPRASLSTWLLSLQQKMFPWISGIECSRLNSLKKACKNTAVLRQRLLTLWSSTRPGRAQVVCGQVVQDHTLCFKNSLSLRIDDAFVSCSCLIEVNPDTEVGQVKIHKIGWERCLTFMKNSVLFQNLSKGNVPLRQQRLSVKQKMFSWGRETKRSCFDALQQARNNIASLLTSVRAFCSATAPCGLEVAVVQVIQRDPLCFYRSMACKDLSFTPVPVALNPYLEVRQIEIDPIGRERGVEVVTNSSGFQDTREDGFPFRHGDFGIHVGRRILSMLGYPCRRHFGSHFWTMSRRNLLQFFRSAGNAGVSFLRQSLRPMFMGAVKLLHSLRHPFTLRFAAFGVSFPLQRNSLSTGPLRDTKEGQQFGNSSIWVNLQSSPDLMRSFQLITVQPSQKSSRVFSGMSRNTANNKSKGFHSLCIIQTYSDFVKRHNLFMEAI